MVKGKGKESQTQQDVVKGNEANCKYKFSGLQISMTWYQRSYPKYPTHRPLEMGTYSILRQPLFFFSGTLREETSVSKPSSFKDIILFVFRKCVASKLWIILSKQKTRYSKSKLASCLDNQKVLPHLKPITAASKIVPDTCIPNSGHFLQVIFLKQFVFWKYFPHSSLITFFLRNFYKIEFEYLANTELDSLMRLRLKTLHIGEVYPQRNVGKDKMGIQ